MGETMAGTTQAAERDLLDTILGPATDGQTYLNLLYLLLAFPLGIAYFVFLIAGLSTGVGLLVVFVGVPILMGVLLACRGLGAFERLLARAMLHVTIPPPLPAPPAEPGFTGMIKAMFRDTATWKSLGYLMLKFPFGIAVFSVLVSSFATSIALILAPWLYRTLPMDIAFWRIETKDEASICCMVGVILLMLCFQLVNGLTFLWGRFAQLMLGPEPTVGQ